MVDKILLVNFDFPPNEGIGGRRWAKLAKGLAKSGVSVYVIKAGALPKHNNSPWGCDVVNERIKTIDLPRTYPEVLQITPQTIIEKILYKWHTFRLYHKHQGTIYDISLGWEKVMLPAVDRICKEHGIETILATGAPWDMLWHLARYVNECKSIRLLVDFRDPWIGARNYGMAGLTPARLKFEMAKQLFVLEKAHWVITPYDHLTKTLSEFAPNSKAEFAVLPHFFDGSDFPEIHTVEPGQEIRIIYGGEMYVECENELNWLNEMLAKLRNLDLPLYDRLHIDFYSPTNRSLFFASHKNVIFHRPIGKAIIKEYCSASALMLLLTKSKKDDLTTKFFEYLPIRKPIIGLGEVGAVSHFIESNELGWHWGPDVRFEEFYVMIKALKNGELHTNRKLDLKPFELKSAVETLLDLIQ
jgi:hypothetical protein